MSDNDYSKPTVIKDKRGRTKFIVTVTFRPDPYGDIQLRALMLLLGYSATEIDRKIDERQIRRAESM